MSTEYRIPSPTDESKTVVTVAREALKADPTIPAHVALGFAESMPTERDTVKSLEDAQAVFDGVKRTVATLTRLRFDGVALAYGNGQVGKGKAYGGQRDLARALGCSQPRIAQILAAQAETERRSQVKRTLRDAAKQGGVADVDGLSSVIHSIAVDATPETVAEHVATLTAGKVPQHVATTSEMDTATLVRLSERVLTLSGDVVTSTTDRDALAQALAMLTTAANNLRTVSAVKATV